MVEAWERIAVVPKAWRAGESAGVHPFTLRVCPRCSAVVPDNDLAQEHHASWHSRVAIGVDFSGAFGAPK